jgi:heme oxygenase (mycobilin-producing)
MTVVKINAIHVPAEMGPHLEARFAQRAHLVEGTPGFEGFELLRPVAGDERYFVVTRWTDHHSFRAWADSDSFRQGHTTEPNQPAVGGSASLLEFEVVDLTAPAQ